MNELGNKNKYTEFLKSEAGIISLFILIKFLIHFYTNIFAGYGIFRDELYYLSCASRPALGYVDQPPLSIWFLTIYKFFFGDSVFAIRMVPALFGSLTLWFSYKITKEMGGERSSLIISLSAVLLAPIYLGMNSYYSMNSIDILLWAITFYYLVRLSKKQDDKIWIILGILLGLGLLHKISFLWMCFGIFHSYMILTKGKIFLKKGIWLTAMISGFLFLPFIIWNLTNDLAHLEFIKNAQAFKYSGITRLGFLKDMLLIMNPLSVMIWVPGVFWLFFGNRKKEFKIIGLIVLTVFLILLLNGKAKAEYISGAMIPLFSAGGIFYEQFRGKIFRKLISYGIATSIIISGIVFVPLALPILPVETFIRYSNAIGFSQPSAEGKTLESLPQFYADMHGWEKMAKNVSKIYMTIPEKERENTVFWGSNYGKAGAVEYFSSEYPLPRAISPHNNFWIWGLGDKKIKNVIFIGGRKTDYEKSFGIVKEVLIHRSKYAIPYENNLTIYLCSNPTIDPNEAWQKLKHFQ